MDPRNQELQEYIRAHHLQGTNPETLKQQLMQAGWDASKIDDAISQFSQSQPAQSDEPSGKKPNPPIAAQILYALGFLGLIAGLFITLLMFIGSSYSWLGDSVNIFGLSKLDINIAATLFGLMVIGGFALINFIRAGKKWALVSYTTVVSLGFVSTLYDVLTQTEIEKLYNSSNPISDFLVYLIVVPLLVILWTKNRKDFN